MQFRAQKSLGQNFLQSRQVVDDMVESGLVDSHDCVVEAGPGKGVLTEALLTCAREVIAIEKDPRLVFYLSFKFKREIETGKLKLITGDILEFDPGALHLRAGGYKVIANIPYYLTGAFLRRFLSHPHAPSCMVLLLQREVAERIVAHSGKESILSLSVKAYGTPKYIQKVPARLFTPQPRVDSAILLIDNISKASFTQLDESNFFELLKTGFSRKRKKLSSNLSAFAPKEKIKEVFERYSISENTRAENLSLSKWKALTRALSKPSL
jgi:16S rRNA (adenine1518-N6/adenine1519-N6)-dimethyltransferase